MNNAGASLGAALEAAACEAGRIAELGLELQDSLSALLRASPSVLEMQALDALAQQAKGLSCFLAALARLSLTAWRVDAAAAAAELQLNAQRMRLALEPCAEDNAAPGFCELF